MIASFPRVGGFLWLGLFIGWQSIPVLAQDDSAAESALEQDGSILLRVYIDCNFCDTNYLRREITYVNYVRDPQSAQIHVLATSDGTGGGGRAYYLDFYGLEEFDGMDDRLVFYGNPDDTDDTRRQKLARTLQLGLVRYAAQTPLAQQLDVIQLGKIDNVDLSMNASPDDDPWNFWTFRTRFGSYIRVEELEEERQIWGSFSANRTTEEWKMGIGVDARYREDIFELTDSSYTRVSSNSSLDGRIIKSIGAHWGFGFGGSAVSSTYRNQDLTWRIAPAIQYNLFPYSESNRRQLIFTYTAGFNSFKYDEETIYGKMSEGRLNHNLQAMYVVNEPWGEADVTLEFQQFLDDPSVNRGNIGGEMDIRLFRGFFFNLAGGASLIRDQIYLAARGATDEEILVRQRQLATNFEWQVQIGLSYRFGSIFNNVVNSRFRSRSGGFTRSF